MQGVHRGGSLLLVGFVWGRQTDLSEATAVLLESRSVGSHAGVVVPYRLAENLQSGRDRSGSSPAADVAVFLPGSSQRNAGVFGGDRFFVHLTSFRHPLNALGRFALQHYGDTLPYSVTIHYMIAANLGALRAERGVMDRAGNNGYGLGARALQPL